MANRPRNVVASASAALAWARLPASEKVWSAVSVNELPNVVLTWKEWTSLQCKLGFLLGMLKCVSWQVEPKLRKRIEEGLAKAEKE